MGVPELREDRIRQIEGVRDFTFPVVVDSVYLENVGNLRISNMRRRTFERLMPGDFSFDDKKAVHNLFDLAIKQNFPLFLFGGEIRFADRVFEIDTFYKTYDQHDEQSNPKPFPKKKYLLMLASLIPEVPMSIIFKSRQMLATLLMTGYYLWMFLYKPSYYYFVSEDGTDSADLVRMKAGYSYCHLPEWFKRLHPVKIKSGEYHTKENHLQAVNAKGQMVSQIRGVPQGKRKIAKYSPAGVLVDEGAFQEMLDGMLAAILPGMQSAESKSGRLDVVSTASPGTFMDLVYDRAEHSGADKDNNILNFPEKHSEEDGREMTLIESDVPKKAVAEKLCEDVSKADGGIEKVDTLNGWYNPKNGYTVFEVDLFADPVKRNRDFVKSTKAGGITVLRYLGEYDRDPYAGGGSPIFRKLLDKEIHYIQPVDVPEPSECTVYLGIDHGNTEEHPTVFCYFLVDEAGDVYLWQEYSGYDLNPDEHYRNAQRQTCVLPDYAVIDPSTKSHSGEGESSIFKQYKNSGLFMLQPAQKVHIDSQTGLDDGRENVKAGLRNSVKKHSNEEVECGACFYISRACPDAWDNLYEHSFEEQKRSNSRLRPDDNDDWVDTCRYVWLEDLKFVGGLNKGGSEEYEKAKEIAGTQGRIAGNLRER